MAKDSNGNFIVGYDGNLAPAKNTFAVKVFHTGQNPNGDVFADGQGIAIGTGAVSGFVWKRASTIPGETGWVQVLP